MDEQLTTQLSELQKSIDGLTTVQKDILNNDRSTDDMAELRGKIHELLDSNEELRKSILHLNGAINNLADAIKKK